MPEVAVIPVKSFRKGKQRLSRSLQPHEREDLVRGLAGHVAAVVESAGLIPLIVTADDEVAQWATSSGFPSLTDPGEGLNAAAASGVAWAEHTASAWIVIHSDLPLLQEDDVDVLTRAVQAGSAVIAPSSDGGTSAIGCRGQFEFAFGKGSFHRHLARLPSPRVIARPGLLLDIDSPLDLDAMRSIVPEMA